ncbi:MAG: FAD-binding oxidoreductase [Massilia sp.]
MPEHTPGEHYYRATSAGQPYSHLQGDIDAELCIVGAGFAGLATAASLMERGQRDIVVLDAERIGHGASGRNGGFVFGGFSLGEPGLVAALGATEARAAYQLTRDAVAHIRQRIGRYGIACDAGEQGVLLANWFNDERILLRQQAFMREQMGVEWPLLDRSEVERRLATRRYSGALVEPDGFHFHPLKYAQGLARALQAGGVRLYEQSGALRIGRHGKRWRVQCAQGEVRARQLLLCCGGYLKRLQPRLSGAMLPIASYVMVTESLGERLGQHLRTGAAVYDTRFAFDYYRPLPDTRLLWGGRIAVRERAPRALAQLLRRDMLKVYPQLADVKIDYAWSGLMSYARHKMPQLGQLPDGSWYGMGFGGHGVAPTTAAGEVLAEAICGNPAPLARFARWGLAPTAGPVGLAAAQLTYWYYQLRDRMRE